MSIGRGIPIVDLCGLVGGDEAMRARVTTELVSACSSSGSFDVINQGITEDVIATAFAVSRQFFARPAAEKMAIPASSYPPPATSQTTVPEGVGLHSELGCFTILAQDDSGGLEILDRGGRPIAAPPLSDSRFINVGDQFARWTNDFSWPTVHRVLNAARRDRYSIAYFVHPNFDATISCLESCTRPDRPAKYSPITAGVDLLARLSGAN